MADEPNDDTTTAKRGRGPAKAKTRQAVGYKAKWEDADQEAKRLRGVLGLAVRMLKRAAVDGAVDDPKVTQRIMEITIETLEEAVA